MNVSYILQLKLDLSELQKWSGFNGNLMTAAEAQIYKKNV